MRNTLKNSCHTIPHGGVVLTKKRNKITSSVSDKQAKRKEMPKEFDHELANEPLTPAERHNNKKTKKRQ